GVVHDVGPVENAQQAGAARGVPDHAEAAQLHVGELAAPVHRHDVGGGTDPQRRVAVPLQVRDAGAHQYPAVAGRVPVAAEVVPEADVEAWDVVHLEVGELRLVAVGDQGLEVEAVVEGLDLRARPHQQVVVIRIEVPGR